MRDFGPADLPDMGRVRSLGSEPLRRLVPRICGKPGSKVRHGGLTEGSDRPLETVELELAGPLDSGREEVGGALAITGRSLACSICAYWKRVQAGHGLNRDARSREAPLRSGARQAADPAAERVASRPRYSAWNAPGDRDQTSVQRGRGGLGLGAHIRPSAVRLLAYASRMLSERLRARREHSLGTSRAIGRATTTCGHSFCRRNGVEPAGIEPATSCLQSRRSPS
jgi:hypothetical protein